MFVRHIALMRGTRRAAAERALLTDRQIVVVQSKLRRAAAQSAMTRRDGRKRTMPRVMLAA